MSEHLIAALATLERELEALDQQRGDLEAAIGALRKLTNGTRPITRGRPRNTNERTNERATRAPTGRRKRSLPDEDGHAILELLKGGPMKPRVLAKRLKLNLPALRYQIKPLVKSGHVVATGATANRQFSLPPRRAAKEGL